MAKTKQAKLKVVPPASDLEWRKGKPKVKGWYNASRTRTEDSWRWFDGKNWSNVVYKDTDPSDLTKESLGKAYSDKSKPIEYRTYYPENARVPRPRGR